MEKRRKNTAFHEAGHAVIGRVLGLVCGGASIVADHDSAGHAILADPWITCASWEAHGKFRDMSSVMLARVIALMAGREAEVVCLGRSRGGAGDDDGEIANIGLSGELNVPGRNPVVAEVHYRRAWQQMGRPMPVDAVANVTYDPAWNRYLARLRQKTRGLICRHKPSIERVAAALLEKDSLSAEEVDSAM